MEHKIEINLHLEKLVGKIEITVLPGEEGNTSKESLEKQIELAEALASKSIQRLLKVAYEATALALHEIDQQDSDH